MNDTIVSVRDLDHIYLAGTPVETIALQGAQLTVRRGQILGLVGPSGAGKSTLVHYLNGLLIPTRSDCVRLFGQDSADTSMDFQALRRRVGLVFQYPHLQLVERFVGDDIAYGPRQMGLSRDEVRERVLWAMSAVGLPMDAFVDRASFSLSGGEMRRVALAGVLAMRPEVLILDEATTGLDPRGRHETHELLRSLNRSDGVTIVIVSNDMDEVATLCDEVAVLYEGRTVLEGSARQVFARGAILEQYGLALPSVVAIAAALGASGIELSGEPITLAEAEEAIWRALTR